MKTFLGRFKVHRKLSGCYDCHWDNIPLEIVGSSVAMIRLIPRCEEKEDPKAEHIATLKVS